MPRRNSPNAISALDDLSHLDELVVDKRLSQRASAKRNRRNRHYEKQFIRNTLSRNGGVASLRDDQNQVDFDDPAAESW